MIMNIKKYVFFLSIIFLVGCGKKQNIVMRVI